MTNQCHAKGSPDIEPMEKPALVGGLGRYEQAPSRLAAGRTAAGAAVSFRLPHDSLRCAGLVGRGNAVEKAGRRTDTDPRPLNSHAGVLA